KKYGKQFQFLVTGSAFSAKDFPHSEENHVKLLVVDGKYFVVGGSGVHRNMNRESLPAGVKEKNKSLGSRGLEKTFRDTDVVGCGQVAKGLRGQFFNLYHKWAVRMGKTMEASEGRFFKLDDNKPFANCERFHEETSLHKGVPLKYVVGGPEHAERNPITREYAELIRSAKSEVRLANLMFIPAPEIISALQFLRKKPGVKVKGYFCGRGKGCKFVTLPLTATAHQHYGLVDSVYEYTKARQLLHKKVATFDTDTAVVGTYNLSKKSDLHDEELVLVMKSEGVVEEIKRALDQDAANSRKIADARRYRRTPSPLGKLACNIYAGMI
ncbi:MAG: phosphatidylserine/phosphatidylglycerophosphate/cardiolipin synthase family protein, partial [Waddliaceae bacterium]